MARIQHIVLSLALTLATGSALAQAATTDAPAKDAPQSQGQAHMDCGKAGQRHDHVAERSGSGGSMASNCANQGGKSAGTKKMPRHDHNQVHKGQ